jgi:superfamily II DNA/RNA helicase
VPNLADQLERGLSALNRVVVPDLWQQQAVTALREGKDVVVQAPTGAGKTLIFELWSNQGRPHGRAIYTVPTRALANDKLAEWRGRGWKMGIATGDLAEGLDAPIVVATLETQKGRLIRGEGPTLLVVDEFQMLGDADRGLNYELALALAPRRTQMLLMSGSVANPQDVVRWLNRLGRHAVLVRHDERPVPLEEVDAVQLNYRVPSEIRGYWPRVVAKVLAEDLGPLLIFAPRRQAAEALAAELARQLPVPNPLSLSPAQKGLVGEALARMLKTRVAYHHSGLSYGARAGVVEPLAKAGQLRVVVATMGLAAGINFSLRSVCLAGESYRRDQVECPLRPDEITQMFGRAGRRGIDETGYVIVSGNGIRLRDGHAGQLARSAMVDWGTLLGLMAVAADQGIDPFTEAVRVQQRLFSTRPIHLGVEESLKHPQTPCGLKTDAERARHVRHRVREIWNSRGEWEPMPRLREVMLREVCVGPPADTGPVAAGATAGELPGPEGASAPPATAGRGDDPAALPGRLRGVLSEPAALEKVGTGSLVVIEDSPAGRVYGRALTVADRLADGRVRLAKWVRRLTGWKGRQVTPEVWGQEVVPRLAKALALQRTPVMRWPTHPHRITAEVSLAEQRLRVPVDRYGTALWRPSEREVLPSDCARCERVGICRELSTAAGTAMLWRRLGLVTAAGEPTRRGRLVSFFQAGDGLAIAAGLEDESYSLEEMIYDLANLDAGFRFCGDDNRWAGRLALACHERYGLLSVPGYLENGLPPKYGAGAEQIVASVHRNPLSKRAWVTGVLGEGDIDRVIIEWRSLLRQVAHAPDLDWPRWGELQSRARAILTETESPTVTALPPLAYPQTRRVDHRLVLRRH